MRRDDRDVSFLWDMLTSSREVLEYTEDVSFDDYREDRMRQRAVERSIEIIGEAARSISTTFRRAHPEIPWRPIIAQRHILAHEYGEVVHERIGRVATFHIPALIEQIEPLIPPGVE